MGESAAVAHIGLANATVARLCAALPVQPTTLIVAAQRLGVALAGTPVDPLFVKASMNEVVGG